jgi:hypothetical protein
LVILHIEKNGIKFHETRITIHRDAGFYLSQSDRRLMQYRFPQTTSSAVLTPELRAQVADLRNVGVPQESEKVPPKTLRAWNAEGWYLLNDHGIWAYTTENGKTPPEELMRVFNQIVKLPSSLDPTWYFKDVCMGFCYDTLAALGFTNAQQRCHVNADGVAKCQ